MVLQHRVPLGPHRIRVGEAGEAAPSHDPLVRLTYLNGAVRQEAAHLLGVLHSVLEEGEGAIDFYEFTFNRESFLRLSADSTSGKNNLRCLKRKKSEDLSTQC